MFCCSLQLECSVVAHVFYCSAVDVIRCVRLFHVPRSSVAMEFALVRWTAEDACGVIPTKWVLQPEKLSPSNLPCAGLCRWTTPKQTYEATIVELGG